MLSRNDGCPRMSDSDLSISSSSTEHRTKCHHTSRTWGHNGLANLEVENLPLSYRISTLLLRSSFISSMLAHLYASDIRPSACFADRSSSESKGGSIVGCISCYSTYLLIMHWEKRETKFDNKTTLNIQDYSLL